MREGSQRRPLPTVVRGAMVMGILLISLGVSGNAAIAGDGEKGKHVYEQNCLPCHGKMGKGDGQLAEVLNPPPANLTSEQTQAKSDAALRGIIENGKKGTAMAPFKNDLKESQITDVLAFLRSLTTK